MSDCENFVLDLAFSSTETLAGLCASHSFSAEACDAAMATLIDGHVSRSRIQPACEALDASLGSDNVVAALQHRQGLAGASQAESGAQLEKAVSGKKGQPDYLVGSDDPPTFEDPPSPLAHPPPSPVDLTIAQPPDADGNSYNEPQWGVNGEPGTVTIPEGNGDSPMESQPIPPAAAEVAPEASAEAPASEAEAEAEPEAEAEAEAPEASEASAEATPVAEAEAEAEESADTPVESEAAPSESETAAEDDSGEVAEEEEQEEEAEEAEAETDAEQ